MVLGSSRLGVEWDTGAHGNAPTAAHTVRMGIFFIFNPFLNNILKIILEK
jgi:hypothetical protein